MQTNYPPDDNGQFSHDLHEVLQASDLASDADTDDSMFEKSEASVNTMSTIRSEEVAEYFQSIFGVPYESDEGVPRIFPANMSLEKLDIISHITYRLVRGGTNVPSQVDAMLRRGGVDGNRGVLRVLEVVTNSGVWAREMAELYPSAALVSVDTKPLVAHQPHARINYEVYDFYAGFIEPDASFDLVYTKHGAKATSLQTKDFNSLLRELHRVLKPNGFLLMDILPVRMYEAKYGLCALGAAADILLHSAAHLAEGIRFTHEFWQRRGVDIATWDDLPSRLDPSHLHWDNSQPVESYRQDCVSVPIRGFRSIDLRIEIRPIGTWSENGPDRIIGRLMQLWLETTWRNYVPVMLKEGIGEDEARAFVMGFLEDLKAVDQFRVFHEFQLMCAQKI